MGSIFVPIAIAIFFTFCWLLSGWIIRNKATKYYGLKRGAVFLIPALLPVYAHLVEYVLLQQACKEAVVYFPEERYPLPKGIITNSILMDNPTKDFGGNFKFIISPETSSNNLVDLSLTPSQFKHYIFKSVSNKNKERQVTKNELLNVRYGYFRELKEYWNSSRINYYIYDFREKKKIAGYSVVHSIFAGGRSIYAYARLMKMPSCKFNSGQYESKNLDQRTLINNAFKKDNVQ